MATRKRKPVHTVIPTPADYSSPKEGYRKTPVRKLTAEERGEMSLLAAKEFLGEWEAGQK